MKKRLTKISRAGSKVFDNATVDAIITVFNESSEILEAFQFYNKAEIHKVSEVSLNNISSPFLIDFLFSDNATLIQKIDQINNTMVSFAECENACATSDFYTVKDLIVENEHPSTNYYKLVNTGTIAKYTNLWDQKPINYAGKYYFPVVEKRKFENELGRSYVLRASRPKLIFKGLNLLDAFLDEKADFLPGKSTMVICSENINLLKFLLGLLNSKLPIFYIKQKYASSSYCGGISFTKDMFNNFPIPHASSIQQKPIIDLVDMVLNAKNNDSSADTGLIEEKIDELVFNLYDLSEEEKEVIRRK